MIGYRLPFIRSILGRRTGSLASARYGGTGPLPDWHDEYRSVVLRSANALISGGKMSTFEYSLRYSEANRVTPVAEHGHKKSFRGIHQVRGYSMAIGKLATFALFSERVCTGPFNKSRVADHNRHTPSKSATTLQDCFYLPWSATCWAASASTRATVSSYLRRRSARSLGQLARQKHQGSCSLDGL